VTYSRSDGSDEGSRLLKRFRPLDSFSILLSMASYKRSEDNLISTGSTSSSGGDRTLGRMCEVWVRARRLGSGGGDRCSDAGVLPEELGVGGTTHRQKEESACACDGDELSLSHVCADEDTHEEGFPIAGYELAPWALKAIGSCGDDESFSVSVNDVRSVRVSFADVISHVGLFLVALGAYFAAQRSAEEKEQAEDRKLTGKP